MPANLTIPPDEFSIDHMPTGIEELLFDGSDKRLPRIEFENPDTGVISPERAALVKFFTFNGTTVLTPAAFDAACRDLNLDAMDRSGLEGTLLILDLEKGVQYGREEIRALLEAQGVDLEEGGSVLKRIVLFRTKLMKAVLDTTDESGNPDYEKLAKVQKDRPGITREGAEELHRRLNVSVVMIDNISFGLQGGTGFHATQALAAPDLETRAYTPLVYHVGGTDAPDFTEQHQGKQVRIELGNPPKKQLPGYPVGVYVR